MFVDVIQKDANIKIHFGYNGVIDDRAMRYLELLRLHDRVITGTVYANTVWIPKEGACQDVLYSAQEVLHMRSYLLRLLPNYPINWITKLNGQRKYNILLLQRSCQRNNKFVMNKDMNRCWSDLFVQQLINALNLHFPSSKYQIHLFSDSNATLIGCIPCQIELFSTADIVVGIHGAAFANAIYMPSSLYDKYLSANHRNGIIVEIVPTFDSRHVPLTGVFARLSFLMGFHHSVYTPNDGLKLSKLVNISLLVRHIAAFWENTRF